MGRELQSKLLRLLQFLETEVGDYPRFETLTYREYTSDRDTRRNVERWAENIISSVVDIAKVILAIESIPLPDSYKETVSRLASVPALGIADASRLASWTRFRNILAHEYVDIRWKSLERFIKESRALHEEFILKGKEYLRKTLEARE